MMALLTLGGVELIDFEIPSDVIFGGAQRLAVHTLIGGMRVVDVMGPDDASLRWAGVFSGPYAGDRARMFDAMRGAGATLGVSWDAFSYNVVIESLIMDYRNPWWIPYQISCVVVVDLGESVAAYTPDLADAILDDLTSASAYFDVSSALSAISVPDALTQGNADYAAAATTLASTSDDITTDIDDTETNLTSVGATETGFDASDLTSLVRSSGTLAQLCAARGYVERCANNLSGAGT
jgi:hypothetical protein